MFFHHIYLPFAFWVWQIENLYVNILFVGTEKYPRGRRGGFAKALGRATGAGVRLPPSPPKLTKGFAKPNKIRHLRAWGTSKKRLTAT